MLDTRVILWISAVRKVTSTQHLSLSGSFLRVNQLRAPHWQPGGVSTLLMAVQGSMLATAAWLRVVLAILEALLASCARAH